MELSGLRLADILNNHAPGRPIIQLKPPTLEEIQGEREEEGERVRTKVDITHAADPRLNGER